MAAPARLTHESALETIEALEERLCRSLRHANSLPELLALVDAQHNTVAARATQAAGRVFAHHGVPRLGGRRAAASLTATAAAAAASDTADASETALAQLRAWLCGQYADFVDALLSRVRAHDGERSVVAMHVLMDLVAAATTGDGRSAATPLTFADSLLERVVDAMLDPAADKEAVLDAFAEEYMLFADVRLFALRAVTRCATAMEASRSRAAARGAAAKRRKAAGGAREDADSIPGGDADADAAGTRERAFVTNAYMILHQLTMPVDTATLGALFMQPPDAPGLESAPLGDGADWSDEDEGEEDNDGAGEAGRLMALGLRLAQRDVMRLTAHRHAFSRCWLAFLRLELPADVFKDVLLKLDTNVLPHLVNPKLLLDFLTDAYNGGGVTAVLALNALFVLIHRYHLDYPDFYANLYRLLDGSIFFVRHRARFFKLLDMFLTSTHISSYLVAAFVKKLARLALQAPPAGIVVALHIIYNLLKRHPVCKALAHRAANEDGEAPTSEGDPYNFLETDPSKCNALNSSLWELSLLLEHYHPKVVEAARLFKTPAFRKLEQPLAKVAAGSYNTVLKEDLKRKLPQEIGLTYEPPTNLLSDAGEAFSSLWT